MARTLAEILRTPVGGLTEDEIDLLDAESQVAARRFRAQRAREAACPLHEPVGTSDYAEQNRGDHRAKCRHCGMDMSRDSGG